MAPLIGTGLNPCLSEYAYYRLRLAQKHGPGNLTGEGNHEKRERRTCIHEAGQDEENIRWGREKGQEPGGAPEGRPRVSVAEARVRRHPPLRRRLVREQAPRRPRRGTEVLVLLRRRAGGGPGRGDED